MITPEVASKSRLFRLRAKIGCPTLWFTRNCSVIMCTFIFTLHNVYVREKTNKCNTPSFPTFLLCFLAHIVQQIKVIILVNLDLWYIETVLTDFDSSGHQLKETS